nr:Adenylate cyclase type 5 [Polyrhizophydium stewartii]
MFRIYVHYIIVRRTKTWNIMAIAAGWIAYILADWIIFPGKQHLFRHICSLIPLAAILTSFGLSFHRSWKTLRYPAQFVYFSISYLLNILIGYDIGYTNASELRELKCIVIVNALCAVSMSYMSTPTHYFYISCLALSFSLIQFIMSLVFGYFDTPNTYVSFGLLLIGVNITGIFFKYSYELHLRRAFVHYRILYHNQDELSEARARSDAVLNMVLPTKIVASLRSLDDSDANTLKDNINSLFAEVHGVTILFADIAGFTEFSGTVTAGTLVGILNELFSHFDSIASELQLEKIKTIGDSIHVAGGVPEQLETHGEIAMFAKRVCVMAVQMIKIFNEVCTEKKMTVKLRVGIHTGSVVGGVMGLWKFKYDIWSQDVDIASLMEQTGKPGLPHVSQATYDFIKDDSAFAIEPSDPVEAFGATIQTYSIAHLDMDRVDISQPSETGSWQAPSRLASKRPSSATVKPTKAKRSDAMERFDRELNRYLCVFKRRSEEEQYREHYMRTSLGSFRTSMIIVIVVHIILVGARQYSSFSVSTAIVEATITIGIISMAIMFHFVEKRQRRLTEAYVDKTGEKISAAAQQPSWPKWIPNGFAVVMFAAVCISAAVQISILNFMTSHIFTGCQIVLASLHQTFFGIKTLYIRIWMSVAMFIYALTFMWNRWESWSTSSDSDAMFSLLVQGGSIFSFTVVSFSMSWFTDVIARMNFFMERENELACHEMETTQFAAERLIMNILPASVIQRLAESEQIQIADDREDLAVVFTSITNFKTSTSNRDWLWILNDVICEFDILASHFGVEKIKTIGTKYMAICEPSADEPDDAPVRTCLFALALLDVIQGINLRLGQDFKLKIGINDRLHLSRTCSYGSDWHKNSEYRLVQFAAQTRIVCCDSEWLTFVLKFAFDVWGDTVNVSSRMESTGKENCIQVTQAVVDRCSSVLEFKERGSVFVKGKGDMTTFWLVGQRETDDTANVATQLE